MQQCRKIWGVGRGIVVVSPSGSYCNTIGSNAFHVLEGPRNCCHLVCKCDASITECEMVFQGSSFEIWLVWGTDILQFSVRTHVVQDVGLQWIQLHISSVSSLSSTQYRSS